MTREQAVKELKEILPQTTAINMAIKALELVEYIEQRYEEECKERREYYADGRYHSLAICDGASYALRQLLDKWKESEENKE